MVNSIKETAKKNMPGIRYAVGGTVFITLVNLVIYLVAYYQTIC